MRDTYGWVYLVRAGTVPGTPVKVGFTTDLRRRFRGQQTFQVETLRVLATFGGPIWAESRLHASYKAYRVTREWYWPNPMLFDEFGLPWSQDEASRPTRWGLDTAGGLAVLLQPIGRGVPCAELQ